MRALMMATALTVGLAVTAAAKPVRFDLPEETAEFSRGPGLAVAQANCVACHSADYISTQPRNLRDPGAFWTAEVNKMRHSYGAPVEDADVQAIVAYLVATYGW
jgi:sulfite dehydrogenase (cytochrome) subunit B